MNKITLDFVWNDKDKKYYILMNEKYIYQVEEVLQYIKE